MKTAANPPRRRTVAAAAAIAGTFAYCGVLDFHKAHDHARPDLASSAATLLDNVRTAPRPAERGRTRTRIADPRDGLGDAALLELALALVVLAASQLPKGSPARRRLAEDAKRLRLDLDVLAATT